MFFTASSTPRRHTAAAPARRHKRRSQRGMVTAELAIGILTATMLAFALCWGVRLIVIHTECADVAAQVARAEARADTTAAAEARQRAPGGASIETDRSGNAVRVDVSLPVSLGHILTITVTGSATMPKEPGR